VGTVNSALDLGEPLTLIGEGRLLALPLGAERNQRVCRQQSLGPARRPKFRTAPRQALIDDVEQALYASKIISYAQGYALMSAMGQGVGLGRSTNGGIALMWRGGCIIRQRVSLGKIKEGHSIANPGLTNLMLDPLLHRRA